MGENNYKKILYIVVFAALALISCWATSESLMLLLPTFPPIAAWAITLAFFLIASFGYKLIADSFNKNIYLENRELRMVGGFILIILFWLICSMPTNTHTFFYRSYVDEKVSTDISNTQGYLAQIKNNTKIEQQIQAKKTELENLVNVRLGELKAEIENEANPGFGEKSKEILASFAEILGVAKIDPLTFKGSALSKQGRQTLYEAYRKKILTLMESKKQNIENSLMPSNRDYRKVASTDYKNLDLVKQYIQDGTLDLNNPMDIKTVCGKINAGYNTIKTYQNFVNFQNADDEKRFTEPNPETRVKRLLNVYDVWNDFIHGEYPGSFIFWILISILVDFASFIFFDLAFKQED
ncbi:MAG: hypothetical protein J5663_10575 [Bacteroidaceae bacterium]|nr:hypothetical protein [Bacteroidaceae bacterium]